MGEPSLDNGLDSNWVRTQREQYKLYEGGMPNSLTKKRFGKLKAAGFVSICDSWEKSSREKSTKESGKSSQNGEKPASIAVKKVTKYYANSSTLAINSLKTRGRLEKTIDRSEPDEDAVPNRDRDKEKLVKPKEEISEQNPKETDDKNETYKNTVRNRNRKKAVDLKDEIPDEGMEEITDRNEPHRNRKKVVKPDEELLKKKLEEANHGNETSANVVLNRNWEKAVKPKEEILDEQIKEDAVPNRNRKKVVKPTEEIPDE